jgi:ATP-binding cassette subfamily B protein
MNNSSEVISTLATKVNQVVSGVISPLLNITSSLIMSVAILIILISINPVVALGGMVAFGFIYGVILKLTRKKMMRYSECASAGSTELIKVAQEGLGGIRDVIIDGTQSSFCKAYRNVDIPMRRALANSQIISFTPRYVIESLGMLLIAIAAYYLTGSEGGLVGSLPVLGALAMGAQRLLPSFQQIYAGVSSLRRTQSMLSDTLSLLDQPLPLYLFSNNQPSLSFNYEVKLQGLSFSYHPVASKVLDNINLNIKKGTRVGFIGITGSGKSTLLDLLMGLLHPSEGKMLVDGKAITEYNSRSWQAHIAHVPQTIFLSDASIAENIAFGIPKESIDMNRVRQVAKAAQIAKTIESWELQYDSWVGERGVRISGGQRQRIGIARALYKQAKVLVLDEATSALDSNTEKVVMEAIESVCGGDVTVLMVAHRLTTLQSCDKIVELESGVIKRQGSYDEVINEH